MPDELGFRINEPDVIHQSFDPEVVVVDLRNGSYYSLSEVGGTAWVAFGTTGALVQDVVTYLADHYRVPSATIAKDLQPFVAQLKQLDLITACVPEPFQPATRLAPQGQAAYTPPSLSAHNDLQELFLLDPVHEVDEVAGWPHRNPDPELSAPAPGTGANRSQLHTPVPQGRVLALIPGLDLLTANMDGQTIVVNRDQGLYCTLGGNQAWWPQLLHGSVRVTEPLAATLTDAGLTQTVPETAAQLSMPMMDDSSSITLFRDLEDQIRPWLPVTRPPRLATSNRTRGILDGLDQFFKDAAETHGSMHQTHYRMGGHSVRVRSLPGQQSQQLLKALEHLLVADSGAAHHGLTIHVWNGSTLPRSPALAHLVLKLARNWKQASGPRGEVLELHSEEVSAIFNPGPDLLSVVDFQTGRAWVFKGDDHPYPYWEIGSPFRFALHEWFGALGLQSVHGAAVGNAQGGVLLVGKGGAGKSTTSLLCTAAGLKFVGDDYCLADCVSDHAQPWIHSLYGTGKLTNQNDFGRLPELRLKSINSDSFESGGEGKGVFAVSDVWPGRTVAGLPLRALVIPRLHSGPDTRIEGCPRSEALLALLPSTVGQLPASTQHDCARIVSLVEKLPAYILHLGSDPTQIPLAVTQVINR